MSGLRSIPNVKIMAGMMEGFGRKGDTMLAHITPEEAKLLKARGGSGTRNPKTGLMEFWGDSDDSSNGGTGDSTGGFGDHGSLGGGEESGIGGPGGDGSNQADRSDGFGNGGLGGNTSFRDFDQDMSMRTGAPESEISTRDGGVNWNDYAMQNYKDAGTLGRLGQEIVSPSIATSRLGMPTAQQMGILGPALGFLGGPVMGLAMMAGAAMGRAQTPEEQAASMAEQAATGAKNSTGQDNDSSSGLDFASLDARAGADTGKMAGVTSVAPPPKPVGHIPDSWDETGFLERNPEVKSAVSNGTWPSGYAFNQTYQQTSGVPYEQAMSTDRNDDLVKTRPGQQVPYKGY